MDNNPWTPFIIMTGFALLTAALAFLAGALKKEED